MVRSFNHSSNSSGSDSEDEVSKRSLDSDEDYDFDVDKKGSSTRIVDSDIKMRIVAELSKSSLTGYTHTKALKKIKWDELDIAEYSPEEIKTHLNEIVKTTGTVRTLGEILASYKKNAKKHELDNHPDRPTKPPQAQYIYMTENKEKLMQKFAKDRPDSTNFHFLSYCYTKFKSLSDAKQDIYKKKAEVLRQKYIKDLAAFFAANPTLKPVKKSSSSRKSSKPSVISPFNEFRQTLNNGESIVVAQQMWRELHPEEKCKFIKKVANMDTDEPTKISKDEWKILEQEGTNGLPKKPYNAYQIYFAEFSKAYKGDRKRLMEHASANWKSISEAKKKVYQMQHEAELENYRKKLSKYIDDLPKDKRLLMLHKFKKELGEERKRKNSNNETVLDDTKAEPAKKKKKKNDESPLKIKKSPSTIDEEELLVEKKKKKKKNDEVEVEEPPKSPKKKKNGESSQESPKKERKFFDSEDESVSLKKKAKSLEPEYPPQTTAHHFMTKIFKGNHKNLPEAYKALSKQMKSKYYAEMKRERQKYLTAVAEFVKTASSEEAAAMMKKAKTLRQQQMKEISWHKDKGTDDETSQRNVSSSSSDSDSS